MNTEALDSGSLFGRVGPVPLKTEFIYHKCGHRDSPTVRTIIEPMRMPRTKRFVATCLMVFDKDEISVERISKVTGVSNAFSLEDAGRARGAVGNKPVISAVERRAKNIVFISECSRCHQHHPEFFHEYTEDFIFRVDCRF